jgi:type IV secretory pathway VirB4 component
MMNDFTKEELERILEGVSWWLDGDNALYSEALINKIQSMIDNYCEHEYLITYACEACFVDECKCHKCAEIIYRGNE